MHIGSYQLLKDGKKTNNSRSAAFHAHRLLPSVADNISPQSIVAVRLFMHIGSYKFSEK